MDRKKYIVEASDDVKKVMAIGVTRGGAIWTDTTDIENLEELNSDYINENYGELQDEAYQRGLDDAWEAAKRISLMTPDEIEKVFPGAAKYNRYNLGYSGVEAIEKLKAYEEKQKADDEIKIGDEVIWKIDDIKLIITSTYKVGSFNWCDGVAQDGKVYSTLMENDRKTGKRYDIQSILEAMRT